MIHELQKWFQKQCDGEWEHHQGITIETCDNPGWRVRIDLKGTKLENKPFETVAKNLPQEFIDQALGLVKAPFACAAPSSPNWMICYVRDNIFTGAGDPSGLNGILEMFIAWAGRIE